MQWSLCGQLLEGPTPSPYSSLWCQPYLQNQQPCTTRSFTRSSITNLPVAKLAVWEQPRRSLWKASGKTSEAGKCMIFSVFQQPMEFKPLGLGLELAIEMDYKADFIFCSLKFLKSSNQISRGWTTWVGNKKISSDFDPRATKIRGYFHLDNNYRSVALFSLIWDQNPSNSKSTALHGIDQN